MNDKTTALVTGANKGLGHETARRLGELGMTVLVGARDLVRGKDAVGRLREHGADAHVVHLDLTDAASIAAAVGDVTERFGRLDVLINNAGTGEGSCRRGRTSRRCARCSRRTCTAPSASPRRSCRSSNGLRPRGS